MKRMPSSAAQLHGEGHPLFRCCEARRLGQSPFGMRIVGPSCLSFSISSKQQAHEGMGGGALGLRPAGIKPELDVERFGLEAIVKTYVAMSYPGIPPTVTGMGH